MTLLLVLLPFAALGCVCAYRVLLSPALRYHSVWYKAKAGLFFWLGDIRRLNKFPWVTWATHHHGLSYRDMAEGWEVGRPGDVGLHKDNGFLSNLGIPGAFKHAWVVVNNKNIVEAISDGVIKRGALAPLVTDYAVLLRPLGVTKAEVNRAVRRAERIVGSDYDANFNFDFERTDAEMGEFTRNLDSGKFHAAFSCTETAGFSWYHCRDKLRLFRSRHAGREAIIADDFLKMNFGIVWLSPSVTVEWAEKNGMHEEGRRKIAAYWAGDRDFNRHGNPVPRRGK